MCWRGGAAASGHWHRWSECHRLLPPAAPSCPALPARALPPSHEAPGPCGGTCVWAGQVRHADRLGLPGTLLIRVGDVRGGRRGAGTRGYDRQPLAGTKGYDIQPLAGTRGYDRQPWQGLRAMIGSPWQGLLLVRSKHRYSSQGPHTNLACDSYTRPLSQPDQVVMPGLASGPPPGLRRSREGPQPRQEVVQVGKALAGGGGRC